MISLAEDKPANARPACGVAWMDWTRKGDNVTGGHDRLIQLAMRYMLSAPTFAKSIDKVLSPGTEQATMGEYYPMGSYTTRDEFETRGC